MLSRIIKGKYEGAVIYAKSVFIMTALAALLTRGEWCINPDELFDRFLVAFPAANDSIRQVEEALGPGPIGEEEACHLLYLYDVFLRVMLEELGG